MVVRVMSRADRIILSSIYALVLLFSIAVISSQIAFGAYIKAPLSPTGATVKDDNLAVEKVTDGLDFPTSIAFLGPDDILVTEKETGKVMRIINGQVQDDQHLMYQWQIVLERGLLGIATAKQQPDGKTYRFSFLY